MLKKLSAVFAAVSIITASAVTVKMNCVYGGDNFHTRGAEIFAKLVEKYSDGNIEIKVFPGNVLVKGNPLKAVQRGSVVMSDMLLPFVSGNDKVFEMSALPFFVKSYEDAYKLYKLAKPVYEKELLLKNQKLLYAVSWPPSGLYTEWEIKNLKDFKGVKARTYDKNSAVFIKAAGGSAVALSWAEVYPALKAGLVNAVLTSSVSGKDGNFWNVLKYFTQINYAYPLQAVTVNLKFWRSLTPEERQIILKAAKEVESLQWKISKEENEKALRTLQAHDMTVEKASPRLIKELDDIADKMLKNYLKNAPEKVKKIIKEYKGEK
jgi:TRAP-type C4-dicarboxylate transport system substrate-binding protein